MSNPKARQADIIVEQVFTELVLYDLERNQVHTLNPTAALVWRHCDGDHTIADLAGLLERELAVPQAEALVGLTLDRLHQARLLDGTSPISNGQKTLSRRELLKMAGLTVALLPVVKSIVAPTAAQAASCKPLGERCLLDSECCSGNCAGTCIPQGN